MCSGRSTTTPVARRAASRPTSRRRAARRTCRAVPIDGAVQVRREAVRACDLTSSSRLPKSTPLVGPCDTCSALAEWDGYRARRCGRPTYTPCDERMIRGVLGLPNRADGKRNRSRWNSRRVGPHPLFVAARGERQLLKMLPGGAAALDQPRRLVARGEKGVEGFLRETGLSSVVDIRYVNDWQVRCVGCSVRKDRPRRRPARSRRQRPDRSRRQALLGPVLPLNVAQQRVHYVV